MFHVFGSVRIRILVNILTPSCYLKISFNKRNLRTENTYLNSNQVTISF